MLGLPLPGSKIETNKINMSKKLTRREVITQGGLALTALALPFPLTAFAKFDSMTDSKNFDVIIIGGSYAGLSAGMVLGRSLRDVLIIDSGLPCNRQTSHSHNFITQDGAKPREIAGQAKSQVLKYETVKFLKDLAVSGKKTEKGFEITTQTGSAFKAKKLVFASGIKDIMPDIMGFAECWGISVIHCPYCHGYEVKNERTGILANGDAAFHIAKLVRNLTKDLTIFTNGKALFTQEQRGKLSKHDIRVVEKEIARFNHEDGNIKQIVFNDSSTFELKAIYSRPAIEQHCKIAEILGCELNEKGLIKLDSTQKTTVAGVFACGDNSIQRRSVANAVATGNTVGTIINDALSDEEF